VRSNKPQDGIMIITSVIIYANWHRMQLQRLLLDAFSILFRVMTLISAARRSPLKWI